MHRRGPASQGTSRDRQEGGELGIEVWEFVASAAIVAAAAAVQGTIGIGFNIVSVPLMSLINPLLAPVPQLILSLPQSIGSAVREPRGIDWSGVRWIVLGRLPGAVLGIWLLSIASDGALDLLIGSMVLVAVIILGTGARLKRNRPVEFGAGVFSGISSYVSTIGGPPVALLYSREEGPVLRATLAMVFVVGLSMTLLARIIAGDIAMTEVRVGLGLLPAAAVGFVLSSWLKERVAADQLRSSILIVSAAAAAALLWRAVV